MRSFTTIDQHLADPPAAITALLAAVEEAHARELRLRSESPGLLEGLGVPAATARAEALSAAGRGPLGVRSIMQAHGVLLARTGTSVPVDGQAAMLLNELVARYELALSQRRHPHLLLVCAFTLDFATIRPFHAGNGRMTRLLLTRELLRDGHDVVHRVSVERLICHTREEHDAALQASQAGWPASEHALWPWAGYLLGVLARAYEELERRASERKPSRG